MRVLLVAAMLALMMVPASASPSDQTVDTASQIQGVVLIAQADAAAPAAGDPPATAKDAKTPGPSAVEEGLKKVEVVWDWYQKRKDAKETPDTADDAAANKGLIAAILVALLFFGDKIYGWWKRRRSDE